MTSFISCPQCDQPVDAQARLCEHCGVDLALAALVAEREIYPARLHTEIAVTPELLVPRLGEYLVEEGHLAPADLERALQYQKDRAEAGRPLLLGQALRELHLIKAEVLDQAITEQILQLHVALKKANEELGQRVRERTSELEQAIEKLGEQASLKLISSPMYPTSCVRRPPPSGTGPHPLSHRPGLQRIADHVTLPRFPLK